MNTALEQKESFMRRALELAEGGRGHVAPNPLVGCVVVKDGKIISEGYHKEFGGFHAERNALLDCEEDPAGAELYVNLEPCCHEGKTPPCTDIIIEKKIAKVYIGSEDPNPLVAGKGIEALKAAGIEVESGILKEECEKLNEVFYYYMRNKRPFVVLKYAMSLDGKIACFTGDAKWVTGEESRRAVHFMRKNYSAIMTGIGTVFADDPTLNCRVEEGVDPVRVICDSELRISPESNILKTAKDIRTIIACTEGTYAMGGEWMEKRINAIKDSGAEILPCGNYDHVDLHVLLDKLGEDGIDSVLLEGGTAINASFFDEKLVNKVCVFIAPKIIAGRAAPTPIGGIGATSMAEAVNISDVTIEREGEDICLCGYPVYAEKE